MKPAPPVTRYRMCVTDLSRSDRDVWMHISSHLLPPGRSVRVVARRLQVFRTLRLVRADAVARGLGHDFRDTLRARHTAAGSRRDRHASTRVAAVLPSVG